MVYRWSGQVYEPADQLGLYGLDPLNPLNAPTAVRQLGGWLLRLGGWYTCSTVSRHAPVTLRVWALGQRFGS